MPSLILLIVYMYVMDANMHACAQHVQRIQTHARSANGYLDRDVVRKQQPLDYALHISDKSAYISQSHLNLSPSEGQCISKSFASCDDSFRILGISLAPYLLMGHPLFHAIGASLYLQLNLLINRWSEWIVNICKLKSMPAVILYVCSLNFCSHPSSSDAWVCTSPSLRFLPYDCVKTPHVIIMYWCVYVVHVHGEVKESNPNRYTI